MTMLADVYNDEDEPRKKRKFLSEQWPQMSKHFANGAIRAPPVELLGGLEHVKEGLERLSTGNYSFTRFVVSPHRTSMRAVAAG